ncbi:MAG: response regulator [Armatimonadetes bacterium]|nr:response regulator [Armatimonadota bacterium]
MENKVILLVEDNPDDIELIQRALRQNHIANEMVVTRDGAEALDYLLGPGAEGRPLPVVILLDLKLPKVDGHEVLRRIRAAERTKLLPVVILTTSDEQEDITRSYANGASSYVRKPVDFDEFVHAARTLGVYWLVLNEPPKL